MQKTSCDMFHYHPAPISPSCFTGLSQPLLQTSAFPTFKSSSGLRPVPFLYFLIHLSPKLPSLQPVKPGKELPLAPSQPLSRRAGARHGAPRWPPQRSPELCCNTSTTDVQAGDGQWCHRLRKSILEIIVKPVQMFQLSGPWRGCYFVSPLSQRKPFSAWFWSVTPTTQWLHYEDGTHYLYHAIKTQYILEFFARFLFFFPL